MEEINYDKYKLPAHLFTWEKWAGRWYNTDAVIYLRGKRYPFHIRKAFTFLGYCDSKDLPVNPKKMGIAIMFYDKEIGKDLWLHYGDPIGTLKVE